MLSESDIGEYEIIKGAVLGTGAFATVWKGRHKKEHTRQVAIKAIKKKNFTKSQQLLSKEITILKELSSLHHKNVVGLLDCVECKDEVCLVMEYCNGGDLADCLHRNGTLSEDTLCSYVKQIGEAMKALQQKGIVHRDLKPQNILLCYEGTKYPHPSEMLLKIADFGFARFICGAEMATTLCGSPMYMAPEVIMSVKYTAKADLWSIGTILYQCLTGRAPFQAQNPQELKKKYEKSPGLKPNIPSSTSPELRDLLMRMLKRDAEERISFEEFFSHPFLKLAIQLKKNTTPPVSVPKRRSSSSSASESSTPSKSPGKSPSPSRNKNRKSPSPSRPTKEKKILETKEEEMATTLTETAGFTKVEKEELKGKSGRSTPDDFVMVPEDCIESGDESVSIKKAPLAEEEMASFSSPHRSPKATRVNLANKENVASSSPKKSSPTKSPTSGAGSPVRPVTLSMATAGRQSSPISVPSDMKSGGSTGFSADDSRSGTKSKVKSPLDVRMESDHQDMTVATRTSENRLSGMDADAGSFSPPAVQFCVGTPPNAGSGPTWRRSSVGMVSPTPYSSSGSPHRRPSALNDVQPMEYHRVSTDSSLVQLHNQNRQGIAIAYGSRERLASVESELARYGSSLDRDRSPSLMRRNSGVEMSPPPHHMLLAHTPPLGPHSEMPEPHFVPQPLSEETLMDDNHNETLGKLSFVLDLVECILSLARTLGSAFRSVDPAESKKVGKLSPEHLSQYRTSQRSLEQLVLYARACNLLNNALHLARDEIRNNRLQQSTYLRAVLGEMNTYFHHVVEKCRTIHKDFTQNCKTPLTEKMVMATADKLIYNEAIQICQAAALDEFSSNPTPENTAEVVRRYQVAQILLHSLAQTAGNENDKHQLVKYRKSVESRLQYLCSEPQRFDRHIQPQPLKPHLVDNQRYQVQS